MMDSSNTGILGKEAIQNGLLSRGIESVLDYELDGFKYDVFIPSANLLVDFYEFVKHSNNDTKQDDIKRYRNTLKLGISYLSVFEDEWYKSEDKILNLIENKIGLHKPIKLRPSKCSIEKIQFSYADSLYESHHYIGKVKAPINYGIFFEDLLIGAVSFKRPTRQSKHEWELIRMVSDPRYRVHGIWSKVLKIFIEEYQPNSIVSFSDNRLFNGEVYAKLGFKYDGNVRPDYYWCRGGKRFHKSGLRKKGHERTCGLTEFQLRGAQGYKRVWDLGKKRWLLKFDYKPIEIYTFDF